MTHPVFVPGAVAVITGGASGIGLAAATTFAQLGLRICIADLGADRLEAARAAIVAVSKAAGGAADVLAVETDVSRLEQVALLEAKVRATFGAVDVLMNNAGVQEPTSSFASDGQMDKWQKEWSHLLGVNLWGVLHGTQVFVPGMLAQNRPGLVINTGSKQGITTPPGNPAYNVSKAGVKAFTEALEHELRNTPNAQLHAHLLIPGFVFTPLTAHGRTEKPDGAWTPEQTVAFMMEKLAAGDFYILCPDNEAPRALDELRIRWAAGDIVENRPALSRWHPDYKDAFADFVKRESAKDRG